MAQKLFVGGLAWATTTEDLHHVFTRHGNVEEAVVLTDRATGRSRGCGFVTYANSEDAQCAIDDLDGTELQGRTIKVNIAHDKPRSAPHTRHYDEHRDHAQW